MAADKDRKEFEEAMQNVPPPTNLSRRTSSSSSTPMEAVDLNVSHPEAFHPPHVVVDATATEPLEEVEASPSLALGAAEAAPVSGAHVTVFSKAWCLRRVETPLFSQIVILLIILNTITLALEHPFSSATYTFVLSTLNYVWTAGFIIEMVLKLRAYGVMGYARDPWNAFDGIVVVISVVEIGVDASGASSGGSVSVLRTFRLLRVLRLAHGWSTLEHLLRVVVQSSAALGNLILILLILIYIFAVLGVQLFGAQYRPTAFPDGEVPRWSFVDFPHAFMLIFRILCGEWIEPLWDTMLAGGYVAILFYISVIFVGNFILFNLFLALLLSAFDADAFASSREEAKEEKPEKAEEAGADVDPSESAARSLNQSEGGSETLHRRHVRAKPSSETEETPTFYAHSPWMEEEASQLVIMEQQNGDSKRPLAEIKRPAHGNALQSPQLLELNTRGVTRTQRFLSHLRFRFRRIRPKVYPAQENITEKSGWAAEGSMQQPRASETLLADESTTRKGFAAGWHKLHLCCKKLIEYRHFDSVILLLIIWSSIMLCFEDAETEFK
jgi:hypothetical protein